MLPQNVYHLAVLPWRLNGLKNQNKHFDLHVLIYAFYMDNKAVFLNYCTKSSWWALKLVVALLFY